MTPLFRFAQVSSLAIIIGVGGVTAVETLRRICYTPLAAGDLTMLIPIVLGVLLFTRFFPQIRYWQRIPLAFQIGAILAIGVNRSAITGMFASLQYLTGLSIIGGKFTPLDNLIIIFGGIVVLLYFIFIRGESGPQRITSTRTFDRLIVIGRYFIMVVMGTGAASSANLFLGWFNGEWRDILTMLGLIKL